MPRSMRQVRPEAAAALFAVMIALEFGPQWLRGLTPFWGDLTYIHQPWRAFPAQALEAGRLPLWDPYLYFGMPAAANMQGSFFYPATIVYSFFGFATGTALFHAFHYWLAAMLTYLWLRRSFGGWAALSGALVFAFGGGMVSRVSFLNHLAVLSLTPVFFLFFKRPVLLMLALACAFLAGYPSFLAGAAASAWTLWLIWQSPGRAECFRAARDWLVAGIGAAILSGCLLLPALELSGLCRRTTAGMGLSETLRFGYSARDLLQWVSPILVSWSAFNPSVEWWKCSYIGFGGCLAAAAGLGALKRRRAWGLAAFLALTVVLILGGSNPLSLAVWSHAAPLRFIRYPGNLFYLALAPLSILVAAGYGRSGRQGLLLGLLAAELLCYGWKSVPWTGRDIFTTAGPLVRQLQGELGEQRYLLSPLALEANSGTGIADWKSRLYGLTNGPFRLRAAGNFGEPLVPKASYDFMDALYSAPSAESAAALFPWGGVRFLLTPSRLPASPLLKYEGRNVWEIYRFTGISSRAYVFDGIKLGAPLRVFAPREDFLSIDIAAPAPSLIYLAEPRYPGWRAWGKGAAGWAPLESSPAAGAFQKIPLPPGTSRLILRYDPRSYQCGLSMTFAALFALVLFAGARFLPSAETGTMD